MEITSMNFAFWRKCDFQVHSPRDPNWKGARPIGLGEQIGTSKGVATEKDVDDARAKWAKEFVDKCICKGLHAIALTDHHEMVMVPYVECELEKRKLADPDFDLWLFPGMELTTRGGKQCLIIFDADLSKDWRKQAQGKLGIEFTDQNDKYSVAQSVKQIPKNYPDISQELDELEGLRGKFIILPNVSQGNSHTVLTDGGHVDFYRMPYVGGYLDHNQTWETLSPKNRKRLSGTDKYWSDREIYPLPTSDSRSSDYVSLGQNNTWIKLAEPTAEAIRQAFLAHNSRIQLKAPQIPTLAISVVKLENSKILGSQSLSLSPQFNSIIGGRGTGKSTFLEYVAFGLGRSFYDAPRDKFSGSSRMQNLIKDTIISNSGSVSLHVTLDEADFEITRCHDNNYQPRVTFPDGETQTVTIKELRDLFPAVVYSQGELAEIGKSTNSRVQLSDLLRFVNLNYKIEDDRLASSIESSKSKIKELIQVVVEKWNLESQMRRLKATRDSYDQRAKALEKNLVALSENDKAIVRSFNKANEFEFIRDRASKHADLIVEELNALATNLIGERDDSIDSDLGANIIRRYEELLDVFESGLAQLQVDVADKREKLSVEEKKWLEKFRKARKDRDKVLNRFKTHKSVTNQIITLREQISEVDIQIGDLKSNLEKLSIRSKLLNNEFKNLWKLVEDRSRCIQDWVKEIELISNGKIKVQFVADGNTLEIKEAIDTLAYQTHSQEATRVRELEKAIETEESPQKFVKQVVNECFRILRIRMSGAVSDIKKTTCPCLLKILGDTENILSNLVEHLDTIRLQRIATAVTQPLITLYYSDGSREISFDKASEGQRAAALLFLLLEQPSGPLIIDQPEGDLDNRVIVELANQLHSAKQKRQLIFASHNANIVVNGSSELVGHIDVNESGERGFENTGAIDISSVREVITSTMEGGEKAFKDRQDKYGY